MTALPAIAAAPVRAATRPEPATEPATVEDASSAGGFAAALELAREPPKAPAEGAARSGGRRGAAAGSGAERKADSAADAECDETRDAVADNDAASDESADGIDATAPDLIALLPGWPPAPLPAVPSATATTAIGAVGAEATITSASATATATAVAAATNQQSMLAGPVLEQAARPVQRPATGSDALRGEPHEAAFATRDTHAGASTAHANTAPDRPSAPPAPSVANELQPQAPKNTVESATLAPLAWPVAQHAMPATASFAAQLPASTAPAFEGRLAAAIDSPAFAPALASQVTWLASEGVQQARITLHPAEMGPLAVRIVLDGSQARIDFSADMAGTRAAIEASLPTLAAALHDSGLTLAGGGVFDGHARQGAQDGRPTQQGGQPTSGNAPLSGAPADSGVAIRSARGLVDLVA